MTGCGQSITTRGKTRSIGSPVPIACRSRAGDCARPQSDVSPGSPAGPRDLARVLTHVSRCDHNGAITILEKAATVSPVAGEGFPIRARNLALAGHFLQPGPRHFQMLGEGNLRVGYLGVPLLLPFHHDVARIIARNQRLHNLATGHLPLS